MSGGLVDVPVEEHLLEYVGAALSLYRQVLARRGYVGAAGARDLEERIIGLAAVSPSVAAVRRRSEHLEREIYTQGDAAKVLGVSPRTILRRVNSGEINTVVSGGRRRVTRVELDRLTERRQSGGGRLLSAHERTAAGAASLAVGAPKSNPREA